MTDEKDPLGNRMKQYEGEEAKRRFVPNLPVAARIDGRAFSSFTRGMARPFDPRMLHCMQETTRYLVEHTNALIGYTQSDEITLIWLPTPNSQIFFDGRIQKMTSQLAAQATLRFYQLVLEHLAEFANRNPTFDCRVWQLPSQEEAANLLLWRERDALKNSVSMLARCTFSHHFLKGKNTTEVKALLRERGIDWDGYTDAFRRGTYFQKVQTLRKFSAQELEKLPAKHAARTNPNLQVERSEWKEKKFPPLETVSNFSEVIFSGKTPKKKNLTP